ncbi:hypothetical protein EJP617_19870 [Erwinia sp. Ejp617]|nr:hypothetical protein [Erwinia sp. Ejp617]ADP11668.1 hypothetical protein EJP617_19870 [Erwinia sp. Ejp617]
MARLKENIQERKSLNDEIEKEIKEYISNNHSYTKEDVDRHIYSLFGDKIGPLKQKIKENKKKVTELTNVYLEKKSILAKTVFREAEDNPHLLSEKMKSLSRERKVLVAQYKQAPYIQKAVENNIKKLTELQEKNKIEMEDIGHLILLMNVNNLVRETNEKLKEVYEHNEKIAEEVHHIMEEETQKGNAISHAISRKNQVEEEKSAVNTHVIKLPDVPTHEPKLTKFGNKKAKPTVG